MKEGFVDTHAHLYLEQFVNDLEAVVDRLSEEHVKRVLLPNIDMSTANNLQKVCTTHPDLFMPMMGLHPTSVNDNYEAELEKIRNLLFSGQYVAVGECGIDLYWDKTYIREQKEVFRQQVRWAIELDLPLVIHARESFDEIFEVLDAEFTPGLKGVFHSFTGNAEHVKKIRQYDFFYGINGIVTFKNSGLSDVVVDIPKERILIETDSPYLAPVPYRGKRNESAYVVEVARKIAEIFQMELNDVATVTTENARNLFLKAF